MQGSGSTWLKEGWHASDQSACGLLFLSLNLGGFYIRLLPRVRPMAGALAWASELQPQQRQKAVHTVQCWAQLAQLAQFIWLQLRHARHATTRHASRNATVRELRVSCRIASLRCCDLSAASGLEWHLLTGWGQSPESAPSLLVFCHLPMLCSCPSHSKMLQATTRTSHGTSTPRHASADGDATPPAVHSSLAPPPKP